MSRLTDLLRQVRQSDKQLARDLEAEIHGLTDRRTFGLVFEPHQPEAVELPGRSIRRGDKVRILPPRGDSSTGDPRLWRVQRIERSEPEPVARLLSLETDHPESAVAPEEDLVVVAESSDRIYPGLVETGRVERGSDRPFHTVINAENYHALEMLTYTHRHALDAIYIDPPYNSGAKDWKYNNHYVESDDDYRHSKWLAFIERRLKIARELLDPDDSVLIVTIDEKEVHRLGLLLDQTFPEASIQMITSVINPKGNPRRDQFSRCDEYIFFVKMGDSEHSPWVSNMLQGVPDESKKASVRWKGLLRSASNGRRVARPNLFYPLYFSATDGKFLRTGEAIPLDQDWKSITPADGEIIVWPIGNQGRELTWSLEPDTFNDAHKKGYVRFGAFTKQGRVPYYLTSGQIRAIEEETGELNVIGRDADGALELEYGVGGRTTQPMTVWNMVSHSATEYGAGLTRALLPDRSFPFPKSLYAVEDTLRFFVKDKPDAKVLDFFAGSGTTAHAVMRLNKQDGGRRQCISVTNNEVSAEEQRKLRRAGLRPGDPEWESLGICDYITKPRLVSAITGKTPDGQLVQGNYRFTDKFAMADGFEENAAFFTLTYETPLSVRHNRAFERIAPMLWLRAGSRGRIIRTLGDCGWGVAEAYGVLENLDHVDAFLEAIRDVPDELLIYIITDDESAFQMVCRALPERHRPLRLYESYLQNFQLNIGGTL